MKLIFTLIPILFFVACKSDSTNDDVLGSAEPIIKKKVEALTIDEGCQFITNVDIANILGINESSIQLRPTQKNGNYAVCVWNWKQNGKRQSLFLRSEKNADVKKYSTKFDNFLSFSLKKGEMRYHKDGTEEKVFFTEVEKLGNKAIWSKGGRILKWHYKNQFLFTLSVDKTNSTNELEKDFDTIKRLAQIINGGIE